MPLAYLVTGASRGLGLEFARQISRRGDRVIAAVRNPDTSPEVRALGAEVLSLDAADPDSIEAFASKLRGKPIDVLINNAGIMGEDRSLDAVSFDTFRDVFDTNVAGPALLTRALLPNLRAGGAKRILNISSTLGSIERARAGFSYAYRTSKAALNMLTAAMHHDLAKDGFTVVSFCPGWNRTDMGGPEAMLDPKDSIASLLKVEGRLKPADSGKYLSHEGAAIPW